MRRSGEGLQLATALEERFGFTLTAARIMVMESMGDVKRVILARLAG